MLTYAQFQTVTIPEYVQKCPLPHIRLATPNVLKIRQISAEQRIIQNEFILSSTTIFHHDGLLQALMYPTTVLTMNVADADVLFPNGGERKEHDPESEEDDASPSGTESSVLVQLLNGQKVKVRCRTDVHAGAIFDLVVTHTNLNEHALFGLPICNNGVMKFCLK
ncbi:hypothetical protein L596_005726 [Steinernema carpocapsae]|uniref:FERM domain-containing protein n=1 Tax=Steinernema carpocapsae TaxID=34508 RepID=A0A4U8UZX8_STECR|nr:hypothetical protein L596_005726 [Steinernema carpocapsae]